MSNPHTPAAERHHLSPDERVALANAIALGKLPIGWLPLEGAPGCWVGPGLTVAQDNDAGGHALIEGAAARALLLNHAFHAPEEDKRRARNVAAQGTPISTVINELGAAFPAFRLVAPDATGALFVRVPHAVLACTGKLGELDAVFWYEGERAIDLVFQYGLSRPLPAPSPEAPTSLALQGAAQPVHPSKAAASASPPTKAQPVLRIPLAWDDGTRLRRGLLLVAGGALAGPLMALPLLALDAVAWLIGTAALWTLAIPLGRARLERSGAKALRPCLELDGHWLRLPQGDAMRRIDLREVRVERSWHGSIYAPPKHGGTRPSEVRLHLRGPDVDLLFAARELSRLPGFPETPSKPPPARQVLELLPADFMRLQARI